MKVLLRLFLLILLIAAGAVAWLWYGFSQPYKAFTPEGVFVNVPHGASRRAVSRLLERNGIVKNAMVFEFYARRHPRRTLQAGEYFFDQAATGKDVFWKLADGQVYEQPFTVREGETMFDIARELEAGKFVTADEFLTVANSGELVHDIAPQARTLDGFLFPATYYLPRHPVAGELAAGMVKKFKDEWSLIAGSQASDKSMATDGRPVTSIVTLASLVERETPKPEERPLVAAVFENRLRKGMLMQCDPTVVYALERVNRYTGTLSTKDLHFESPYNTYVHPGLPPGPIGNPGEASLRAALQPAQSEYLYFVANTQGGHFFSSTLAEHNKNVVKYRRLLAGLPADPPPVAPSKKIAQGKHRRGAAK